MANHSKIIGVMPHFFGKPTPFVKYFGEALQAAHNPYGAALRESESL